MFPLCLLLDQPDALEVPVKTVSPDNAVSHLHTMTTTEQADNIRFPNADLNWKRKGDAILTRLP